MSNRSAAAALTLLLIALTSPLMAQDTTRTPDECFGFSFGAWDPPLKSVASKANPGSDPVAGAAPGAPRGWAARESAGRLSSDSLLILFPSWWPSGVTIEWTSTRGDTLIGIGRALVADGALKAPVSMVRGRRVPCLPVPPTPPSP